MLDRSGYDISCTPRPTSLQSDSFFHCKIYPHHIVSPPCLMSAPLSTTAVTFYQLRCWWQYLSFHTFNQILRLSSLTTVNYRAWCTIHWVQLNWIPFTWIKMKWGGVKYQVPPAEVKQQSFNVVNTTSSDISAMRCNFTHVSVIHITMGLMQSCEKKSPFLYSSSHSIYRRFFLNIMYLTFL